MAGTSNATDGNTAGTGVAGWPNSVSGTCTDADCSGTGSRYAASTAGGGGTASTSTAIGGNAVGTGVVGCPGSVFGTRTGADISTADFPCGAGTTDGGDTAGTSTAIATITGSTGTGTVVGGDIAGRPDVATTPGTGFCAAGTSTDFASGPDTPTRADIGCGANGTSTSIATGIDTAGTIIATGTSISSGTVIGSRGADCGTVGGRIRTDAHTASSPHVDDCTSNGINTAGRIGIGIGRDTAGNTTIGTRPGTGTATRFRITAGVRTRPGVDADRGVDRAGHRREWWVGSDFGAAGLREDAVARRVGASGA
ncbi:hypothetical protein ACFYV7_02095 [Nocardia suismassiliense]|uniref:Uncharacterized protein n=1 Tax=Nocardia suismassiliense TaxID=2077092 RepID=A0ABW6QK33_9NOCA